MNHLITALIQSSKGYSHETVGIIIGFFDSPQQALCCADKIAETIGRPVEVCGSSISLFL